MFKKNTKSKEMKLWKRMIAAMLAVIMVMTGVNTGMLSESIAAEPTQQTESTADTGSQTDEKGTGHTAADGSGSSGKEADSSSGNAAKEGASADASAKKADQASDTSGNAAESAQSDGKQETSASQSSKGDVSDSGTSKDTKVSDSDQKQSSGSTEADDSKDSKDSSRSTKEDAKNGSESAKEDAKEYSQTSKEDEKDALHTAEAEIRSANGSHYTVTVSWDEKAKLPDDTEVSLIEVNQEPEDPDDPAYKKRPYEFERFVTEKKLRTMKRELSKGLKTGEDDYTFFTEFLDITLTANGQTVTPEKPVTVTIDTTDVDPAASDALLIAAYDKEIEEENSRRSKEAKEQGREYKKKAVYRSEKVTNLTDQKEETEEGEKEAKTPAEKRHTRISFETRRFDGIGLAGVATPLETISLSDAIESLEDDDSVEAAELLDRIHSDDAQITVLGAGTLKTELKTEKTKQLQEGLELLSAFSVSVKDQPKTYTPVFWVRTETAEEGKETEEQDASETKSDKTKDSVHKVAGTDGYVATYDLENGKLKKELSTKSTAETFTQIQAGESVAVLWDSGYRKLTLKTGDVTLKGMLPEDAQAKAKDVTKDYSDPKTVLKEAAGVDGSTVLQEKEGSRGVSATLAAYDISIRQGSDDYQPDEDHPVTVTLKNNDIEEGQKLEVWHVKDDGSIEIVEDVTVKDGKVSFDASGFSVYMIVYTVESYYRDSEGKDWKITAKYGPEAGLPADVELKVRELGVEESENYLDGTAEALGKAPEGVKILRAFDISFEKDGIAYHKLGGDVDISIELIGENLDTPVEVVHFGIDNHNNGEEGASAQNVQGTDQSASGGSDGIDYDNEGIDYHKQGEVVASTVEGNVVSLSNDEFSVYVIAGYTVDFHWGEYEYNLKGGGTIYLSELLSILAENGTDPENSDEENLYPTAKLAEITADMNQVESVRFSNPELLTVEQKSSEQAENDWLLISYEPFDTDETLTIRLVNGEEIIIHVTDAAPASYKYYVERNTGANGTNYNTLAEAVEAINSRAYACYLYIGEDCTLNAPVTFTNTRNYPVTIYGNNHTITRGSGVTGDLITYNRTGANLLSVQNLTLDGANIPVTGSLLKTANVQFSMTGFTARNHTAATAGVCAVDASAAAAANYVRLYSGSITGNTADGSPANLKINGTTRLYIYNSLTKDVGITSTDKYKNGDQFAYLYTTSNTGMSHLKNDKLTYLEGSSNSHTITWVPNPSTDALDVMFGFPDVTIDDLKTYPTQADLSVIPNGALAGENNEVQTNPYMVWKSAEYNDDNSIDITLNYFEKQVGMKLDFIFVIDETGTMGDNKSANGYTMKQALWARYAALEASKGVLQLNTDYAAYGTENRVRFISWGGTNKHDTGFINNYATARASIDYDVIGGGTNHSYAVNAATEAAQESVAFGHKPIIIYLSDYAAHFRVRDAGGSGWIATSEMTALQNAAEAIYAFLVYETYDATHANRMSDMTSLHYYMSDSNDPSTLITPFVNIVHDAVARCGKNTSIVDTLTSGPADGANQNGVTSTNGSGDASNAVTNNNGVETWKLLNGTTGNNRLYTGRMYTKVIHIPMTDDVYSGETATNQNLQVKNGNTVVNEITTSPKLNKSLKMFLGMLTEFGEETTTRISSSSFTLTKNGSQVWTGSTDSTGALEVPFADGTKFESGETYVLTQTSYKSATTDNPRVVQPTSNYTWTLTVGSDGKITSTPGTDTPAMTTVQGKFGIWNTEYVFHEAPLIPIVIQKLWNNTPGYEKEQTVPITLYAVKSDNSEVKITAYSAQDRESEHVTQLTSSDRYTDGTPQLDWARKVWVEKYFSTDGDIISYKLVEGNTAQSNVVVLPATDGDGVPGDWGSSSSGSGTVQEENNVIVQEESFQEYRIPFQVNRVKKTWGNNTDPDFAQYVVDQDIYENVSTVQISFNYEDSGENKRASLLITFPQPRSIATTKEGVQFINLKFPNDWVMGSIYDVKINGNSVGITDKLLSAILNTDKYKYVLAQVKFIKGYLQLSQYPDIQITLDMETLYSMSNTETTSVNVPLYTLTNNFNPYKRIKLQSTWVDSFNDGTITKVKYTVKDGSGNVIASPEVDKNQPAYVYIPANSGYTVAQESYTVEGLTDPVLANADTGMFAAYSTVNNHTQNAIYTVTDTSDGMEIIFTNTRKQYDATVKTEWDPMPEAADPVLDTEIKYVLRYATYFGGSAAIQEIAGSNKKTDWQMIHNNLPSYSIDGTPTTCELSLADIGSALDDYNTTIDREEDINNSTLTFTINNKIKTAEIDITKEWRNAEWNSGSYPRPDSINVMISGDGVNETRTISADDGWGITVELPIRKTYTITETVPELYHVSYSGGTGENANQILLTEDGAGIEISNSFNPIARVSNDDGETWEYFEYLITSGGKTGAFNYANTLSGDVIIETLKEGNNGTTDDTKFDGETVGRYTLPGGTIFNNNVNITLRTAPGLGFTSVIHRGYTGISLFTSTGNFTLNDIILDGDKDHYTRDQSGDGSGNGGLVYATAGTLTVGTGTMLRNSSAAIYGGAIAADGSGTKVVIMGESGDEIQISNCSAGYCGGGICIDNGADLSIEYVNISGCSASAGSASEHNKFGGGGIAITSSDYDTTGLTTSAFIDYVTVTNCTTAGIGGGIFASRAQNVSITNSTFGDVNDSTKANGGFYGGNIGLAYDTVAELENINIYGNIVTTEQSGSTTVITAQGGGVYAFNSEVSITNSNIRDCAAYENGGAIYLTGTTAAVESGILINGNTTGTTGVVNAANGCGVYVDSAASFIFTGGEIINCTASGYGGGIYTIGTVSMEEVAKGSDETDEHYNANLKRGTIERCSAAFGGGVFVDGTTGNLTMTGGAIEYCTATGNGGGIYKDGTSTITMSVDSDHPGIIDNCTAVDGAGVYVAAGELDMTGGTIQHCIATGNGGGIYNKSRVIMNGDSEHPGVIDNCSAVNGGGIFVGGRATNGATPAVYGELDITGGTIQDCVASNNGGAIYDDTSSNLELSGLTINGHVNLPASTPNAINGGGIYLPDLGTQDYNPATLTISGGSKLYNLTASGDGGAVFNGAKARNSETSRTTVTIKNTEIDGHYNGFSTGQTNAGRGGAIFMQSGWLTVGGSGSGDTVLIKNCTATTDGGAIYNMPPSTMPAGISDEAALVAAYNLTINMTNVTIDGGNLTNAENGGGIFMKMGKLSLDGCTLQNLKSATGAAIYARTNDGGNNAAEVTIKGGTISGNTATGNNGGAINTLTAGSAVVKINFEGDAKVENNTNTTHDTGNEHNMVLSYDNNTVINTTAAGLGENAHIGVYVIEAQMTKHGVYEMPFGTWKTTDDNLDRFTNDKDEALVSMNAVDLGKTADDLIYWGRYLCKIVDTSGTEHVFPTLNKALDHSRANTADYNNGVCTIQMLMDYYMPSSDVVNLNNSKDKIVLTTAPIKSKLLSGEKYAFKATFKTADGRAASDDDPEKAIIKRGSGNSSTMFTVQSGREFKTSNIVLDAGATFSEGVPSSTVIAGRIVEVKSGGTMTVNGGSAFRNVYCSVEGAAIYAAGSLTIAGTAADTTNNVSANPVAFENCRSQKAAGAVRSTAGTLSVSNCNFEYCSAGEQGGALFHNGGTQFNATDCTFTNCKNYVASKSGGAMETQAASVQITGCTFDTCISTRNAGAVNFYRSGDITGTVSGCTFLNCETKTNSTSESKDGDGFGGALRSYGTDKITVTDCTFSGCKATWGGAISCFSSVEINGTTEITDCTAKKGGGVYLLKVNDSSKTLTLSSGTIHGNSASVNGGGIYQSSGTLNISGGSIQDNTADENGGGVYLGTGSEFNFTGGKIGDVDTTEDDGNGGTTTIHKGNSAVKGGGIYQDGGTLTIEGGSIINNTASSDGGGIYLGGTNSKLYLNSGTIGGVTTGSGNNAVSGGGIYQNGGELTIGGGNVQGNTATSDGGGIYLGGTKSKLFINSGSIGGTIAGAGNNAVNGGGIYQNGGELTMNDGSIQKNTASSNGGGIYLGGTGSKLILNDGTIGGKNSGNSADNGGGIYQNSGTLTMADGDIKGNTATTSGGGVYLGGGSFTINGGDVGSTTTGEGNNAANGAGLYVADGASANIFGGNVKGNHATLKGGGIAAGGLNSRMYFAGSIQVWDNTQGSDNCNVLFDWDDTANDANNNLVIQTEKNNPLSEESHIGVYVVGEKTDSESLFGRHGDWGKPFGTFDSYDNLHRFINDRSTSNGTYEFYYGTRHPETAGDKNIYWVDYHFEITDAGGNLLFTNQYHTAPALYRYLGTDGAFYALGNRHFFDEDGNPAQPAYVKTLVPEYSLLWSDTVNVPAVSDGNDGYLNITLTTAESTDQYRINTGWEGITTSTIKRGNCGVSGSNYNKSMFTMAANSKLTLNNITIDGENYNVGQETYPSYTNANGGLFNAQGDLTLDANATLKNSRVGDNYSGAAICFTGNGSFTMNSGAIIDHCKAKNGAVLGVTAGTMTLKSTLVGEANRDENSPIANVTGCTSTYGGAVYVKGSGELKMDTAGAGIKHFEATQGGAIFVTGSDAKVTISNGEVSKNRAYGTSGYITGGAMRIEGGAEVTISGGTISDNILTGSGDLRGGAIHVKNGNLSISGGTISGNTVTAATGKSAFGGAIHVSGDGAANAGELTITGGTISGNTAEGGSAYGGAISVEGENASTSISGTTAIISGNTANGTNKNYGAYGGAVYVKDSGTDGTLTLSGGKIYGNTCTGAGKTDGAGIYLTATGKMNISDEPEFHKSGENDNTVTLTGYSSKKNGDDNVYTENKVRQDIYIAESNDGNPQSIVVTGNLTGDDGSIWVWAQEEAHYQQLKAFAKLDDGVVFADEPTGTQLDAANLKVFRNAQDDGKTDNPLDTNPKWLYGTIEGDAEGFVYWHGVAGSRKVILRKVDSTYTAVNGKTFSVYKGSSLTEYTPKGGTQLKDLPSGSSGCFWIGELPYGWYIIEEENPQKYFYVVVTANGTFGTLEEGDNETWKDKEGGFTDLTQAQTEAAKLYTAKK